MSGLVWDPTQIDNEINNRTTQYFGAIFWYYDKQSNNDYKESNEPSDSTFLGHFLISIIVTTTTIRNKLDWYSTGLPWKSRTCNKKKRRIEFERVGRREKGERIGGSGEKDTNAITASLSTTLLTWHDPVEAKLVVYFLLKFDFEPSLPYVSSFIPVRDISSHLQKSLSSRMRIKFRKFGFDEVEIFPSRIFRGKIGPLASLVYKLHFPILANTFKGP